MTDSTKNFAKLNRIPAEQLSGVTAWQLPEVSQSGNILPSAEKEAREQKQQQKLEDDLAAGESVEDVDFPVESQHQAITAEQLQDITAQAESEGRAQGYSDGLEKGLEEGREQGRAEGLEAGKEEIEIAISHLQEVAQSLMSPLGDQLETLQQQLQQTVLTLTRGLVQRELQTDSSHILEVVNQAIAALPVGSENLTITLNPDDLAQVETYAQGSEKSWHFQSDPELLPGGCRVQSVNSLVDFSVEKSCDKIFQQYLDGQLSGSTAAMDTDEFIPGQLDGDWQNDIPEPSSDLNSELGSDLNAEPNSELGSELGSESGSTPDEFGSTLGTPIPKAPANKQARGDHESE